MLGEEVRDHHPEHLRVVGPGVIQTMDRQVLDELVDARSELLDAPVGVPLQGVTREQLLAQVVVGAHGPTELSLQAEDDVSVGLGVVRVRAEDDLQSGMLAIARPEDVHDLVRDRQRLAMYALEKL